MIFPGPNNEALPPDFRHTIREIKSGRPRSIVDMKAYKAKKARERRAAAKAAKP